MTKPVADNTPQELLDSWKAQIIYAFKDMEDKWFTIRELSARVDDFEEHHMAAFTRLINNMIRYGKLITRTGVVSCPTGPGGMARTARVRLVSLGQGEGHSILTNKIYNAPSLAALDLLYRLMTPRHRYEPGVSHYACLIMARQWKNAATVSSDSSVSSSEVYHHG